MKISSKPVHKFLSYLVHKQTQKLANKPSQNITSLAEVINKDEGIILYSRKYIFNKKQVPEQQSIFKTFSCLQLLKWTLLFEAEENIFFICCFTSSSTARVILRLVVYRWRKTVHTAL